MAPVVIAPNNGTVIYYYLIGGKSTMKRVYNFSAGPSILREKVLKIAAEEMLDYQGLSLIHI